MLMISFNIVGCAIRYDKSGDKQMTQAPRRYMLWRMVNNLAQNLSHQERSFGCNKIEKYSILLERTCNLNYTIQYCISLDIDINNTTSTMLIVLDSQRCK